MSECRCPACIRRRTILTPRRVDEATGAVRPVGWPDPPAPNDFPEVRYQDLHEQLSPNDFPETRQHDFAPMPTPPNLRGLSALVPDPENVERVEHHHDKAMCTLHYRNGTARNVMYSEIMGSRTQLARMLETPIAPPAPPPAAPKPEPKPSRNFRRIRLE